jgi:DNA-binding CsgD family transcriptional regulator
VSRSLGQHARAAALFQESLTIRREQGDRRGIAECFEGLALAADARRKPAVAAPLLGAADALRGALGAPLPPHAAPAREQLVAGLRRRLGSCYDDLHAEGAGMPLDVTLGFAIGSGSTAAPDRPRRVGGRRAAVAPDDGGPDPSPVLLSPREREVSALVARGMSNREIAVALVVTEGTAANYVKRILAKLGFRSRTQIAVWAARLAAEGTADPSAES